MTKHNDSRKVKNIVNRHFAGYDKTQIIEAIAYWWKLPTETVWALYREIL